jgi:hypothetical protein
LARNRPRASSASVGIVLPGQQGFQDGPPGLGQQRRGDAGQLDPGVLHHLLQPLDHPGALLDQGAAVAGQVPQLADRWRWDEAGPDQAVLDHLRDPGRVGHVGLAAGHVVQMLGVDQPHLELVFEQVVHGLPVDPGGLHPGPGHPVLGQPVG